MTAPILMRRVQSAAKARKVGDFFWEVHEEGDRSINVLVPNPDDPEHPMLARCGVGAHGWHWDGNSDRPTLRSSVLCMQSKTAQWHGFIRNGFLVAA